jgi:hypothetical protein
MPADELSLDREVRGLTLQIGASEEGILPTFSDDQDPAWVRECPADALTDVNADGMELLGSQRVVGDRIEDLEAELQARGVALAERRCDAGALIRFAFLSITIPG